MNETIQEEISKNQQQERTENLEPNAKADIIKSLAKLLKAKQDGIKEEIKYEDRRIYLTACNVAGFIPKTTEFRDLIRTYTTATESTMPPFAFDYAVQNEDTTRSKYSTEYLKVALEICKHYEHVKISTKKDYPLRIETEDFDFILAPRINED